MKNLKKGFTLAEVLITLSIIGIIAAVILPSVMSSYQYKTVGVKLAKFLATTEGAARAFMVNEGNIDADNAIFFVNDSFAYTSFDPANVKNGNKDQAIMEYPKLVSKTYSDDSWTEQKGDANTPVAYLKDGTSIQVFIDKTPYGSNHADPGDTNSAVLSELLPVEKYGAPILRINFNPRVQGLPATARKDYNLTVTELGYIFPHPDDKCAWQLYSENYKTTERSFRDGKKCHVEIKDEGGKK